MFDRRAKLAFIVVAATLLVATVGFHGAVSRLNLFLAKEPVPLREPFVNIPRRLGEWEARGRDPILDEAVIETLGTEQYLNRAYVREDEHGETRADVHLAYYTGVIDAIPHVPDRCFLAAGLTPLTLPKNHELQLDRSGWRQDTERVNRSTGEPYPIRTHVDPITGRPIEVRLPVGTFAIRAIEFDHESLQGAKVIGGYFFIANGRVTPSPEHVKSLAFDIGERFAYFCKVQIAMPVPADLPVEAYVARCSDLLDHLLPEVMRCLPDWSEVELASFESPPELKQS